MKYNDKKTVHVKVVQRHVQLTQMIQLQKYPNPQSIKIISSGTYSYK